MTSTSVEHKAKAITESGSVYGWQTILFNCYCHSWDEAVNQIMKAIGCSLEKAAQLADVAEKFGNATVFKGTREQCETVADILGEIGLEAKVTS